MNSTQVSHAGSRSLDQRLEGGELVYFERCPFSLPHGDDLKFLLSRAVTPSSKSITYFPSNGIMGGHLETTPEEETRLRGLLSEFSRVATDWLGRELPRYRGSLRFGPLRFRTEEEEGRDFDPRYTGTLLHVDANGDMPANGASLLRIFVNINPEQSREWSTSVPLSTLLEKWGDRVRDPEQRRPSLSTRFRLRFGDSLGMSRPTDTEYEKLMLRLHFFGKTDDYLQNEAPRTRWIFPPGSAWVVFSDIVSHAVVRGRFAIDQTYLVPAHSFRDYRRSTMSVFDRYLSARS